MHRVGPGIDFLVSVRDTPIEDASATVRLVHRVKVVLGFTNISNPILLLECPVRVEGDATKELDPAIGESIVKLVFRSEDSVQITNIPED